MTSIASGVLKTSKMKSEPKIEHPELCDVKNAANTWRILFVDSPERNEILKEACKEHGYDVIGAPTLTEAWLFLNGKDHVDVIVCAAHLEHESMFEFLHGVRTCDNALHRNAAFLILSLEPGNVGSRLDKNAAVAGLALGADAFLPMPEFDVSVLVQHLRRLQPVVPTLQQTENDGKSQ